MTRVLDRPELEDAARIDPGRDLPIARAVPQEAIEVRECGGVAWFISSIERNFWTGTLVLRILQVEPPRRAAASW
jgi:hypothetical protein